MCQIKAFLLHRVESENCDGTGLDYWIYMAVADP